MIRWNGPLPQHQSAKNGSLIQRHKIGAISVKHVTTIRLDLTKQVFQIHGVDVEGPPIVSRKLRRAEVLRFFKKQSMCLVGIGACWVRITRPGAP